MELLRTVLRSNLIWPLVAPVHRPLHTSSIFFYQRERARDRRDLLRGVPTKTDGAASLDDVQLATVQVEKEYSFPDQDTPNRLFNDIPYSELPIVHIKCSKNNTLMLLVDLKNKPLIWDSCGRNGFKHCRKGTTVAAQVTGEHMGSKLLKEGYKTIRVCIKGLGPGRIEGVKGIARAGVTVASISDITPYDEYPPRPPLPKSL